MSSMDFPRIAADSILAANADAVVVTDAEGIIRAWNPGAERIFGHAAGEALGQSLDLIIPERLRARHWEGFHEVIRTGRSRYGAGDLLAVPGIRKDGQRISLEFTIVPFHANGGHADGNRIAGMVAVMRDVTARFEETRRLKQQLAEARAAGG
jgi:PAS domain S-box-containing protein